jgi:hypothetical protein
MRGALDGETMTRKYAWILLFSFIYLFFVPFFCFGHGSFGDVVNNFCGEQIYTGDCSLCHSLDKRTPSPGKDAFWQGSAEVLGLYFCSDYSPPSTDLLAVNQFLSFAAGLACGLGFVYAASTRFF